MDIRKQSPSGSIGSHLCSCSCEGRARVQEAMQKIGKGLRLHRHFYYSILLPFKSFSSIS